MAPGGQAGHNDSAVLALWGTKLKDAVKSLTDTERQRGGCWWSTIDPVGGGTYSDQLPGRGSEPGAKPRRVLYLISAASKSVTAEAESVLTRQCLQPGGHER